MLKHNKKRNIGLLSEFFAKYIAKAVVDFRQNDIENALNLWRKYVYKNKELFEEYKIFNMFETIYIKNGDVVNEFLKEARNKVIKQDHSKIEKLKTDFIHEINRELNKDQEFFNRTIDKNKYQANANMQMLINCWREANTVSDASYYKLKDHIVEYITTEKEERKPLNETVLKNTKNDIDQMVINIFKEKIENKYSKLLSEDQKKLIGWFVFAKDKERSKKQLSEALVEIKNKTLSAIEKEIKINKNSPSNKLIEVKQKLINENLDINNPKEEDINFYLILCDLKRELESE